MLPLHQALLALTAAGADRDANGVVPTLDAQQWDSLFDQACQQNVAPQVCVALERHIAQAPLDTKIKFATIKAQTASKYLLARRTLAELLQLFNAHGIDTMLLKGLTLSRLYPRPEERHFGDIDYYQYGRWREADTLVKSTYGIDVTNNTHHHSKFSLHGLLVENHYDFIARYGHRGNGKHERLLKSLAGAKRRPHTLDGQACLLPPENLAAVFYLRHMAAHFSADRISLRHLLDWTLFCQHEGDEVDWNLVADTASRFGYLTFATAMEELCRRHLGHTPRLPQQADATLADRVLNEILASPFEQTTLHTLTPLKRIAFKWHRRKAARWKHDICYAAPWTVDLIYGIGSKVIKPYTILH